ncbi:MAG: hypothetical protein H6737_31180 [Alphaproteobacteria bacterium]|nr:hypothetical protein [Alphaproteobacteria bacterium]
MLTLLFTGLLGAAEAATVTLCASGCNHNDFSNAVSAAGSGGTVIIQGPGVWSEGSTISQSGFTVTATVPGAVVRYTGSGNLFNFNGGTFAFEGFTFDCNGAGNLGTVNGGNTIELDWMEVTGCSASQGALFNVSAGVVTIRDSYIHDNSTSGQGGVIYGSGDITMTRSLFCGNTATGRGGIWYAQNANHDGVIHNNIFFDTTGGDDGGLFYLSANPYVLDFEQNAVVSNTTTGDELLFVNGNGTENYDRNFIAWNTTASCMIDGPAQNELNANHWYQNTPNPSGCSPPALGNNSTSADPGITEPGSCDPSLFALANNPRFAGPFMGPDATGGAWDDADSDGYMRIFDCDDTNALTHDGATEICDLEDNDCDGLVDEGLNCNDSDNDGYTIAEGDCNDSNPNVYPGAPIIVGDGLDNDCSGDSEECYTDADGDGYTGGIISSSNNNCNQGGESTTDDGDCNDTPGAGAAIHPGAAEICDGIDNDCAGGADNGLAFANYWPDSDGDGEGDDQATPTNACSAPSGHVTNGLDCDDGDAAIRTSASEVCNGVDDDCDGAIDDGLAVVDYWPDADGDTWGANVAATPACSPPANSATRTGDCNDTVAAVNPAANEITCDSVDNDCSAATPDSPDGDGDGVGMCTDCNDADPARFPGNPEICDGIDNNCNGQSEEGLTFVTYYTDLDSDGYGVNGTGTSACTVLPGATVAGDCNDTPGAGSAIHPGATELCDGIDNDCNGAADFGGGGQEVDADNDTYLRCEGDCRDTDAAIHPGATEVCDGKDNDCSNNGVVTPDEVDNDNDSYVECANWVGANTSIDGGDCDDADSDRYPGNPEVCDGVDNDCFGGPDDGLLFTDYWVDVDGDDYGDETASPTSACQQPPGTADNDTDCDDGDNGIHPGAGEACDGIDNDCNGQVDDGITNRDYYADADGDGYGAGPSTGNDCQPPNPGDVPNDTDCNDADANVNPGEQEVCDAVDHDCDTNPENGLPQSSWWPDVDGDTFGSAAVMAIQACAAPPGMVGNNGDCNDALASIRPNAAEICDGIDNDCDTLIDLDDGLPSQTYYDDPDGDGWGDATDPGVESCAPVPGLVSLFGDCDESDPSVNPGQLEECDGVDNDCSGIPDDGLPEVSYWDDVDDDGFGGLGAPAGQACEPPAGTSDVSGDCDDGDDTIYPGAVEQCDQLDNNCNGLVDDNVATTDWFVDADDDGFGDENGVATADCLQPPGTVANRLDCDDDPTTGPDVNPAATEICDGIDNDCDGDIDDDDPDLDGNLYYPDSDQDGFGSSLVPGLNACSAPPGYVGNRLDCADGNRTINPVAVEACPDGIDNDCDGLIDADDPNYTDSPVTYWFDQDGDGYGTPSLTVEACSGDAPLGYVPPTVGLDCNDGEFATHPGQVEVCDGLDNDCDNVVDEGFATNPYWPDADDDGYGDAFFTPLEVCDPSLAFGLVENGDDCDDSEPTIHPAAVEVCDDGVDNDCDGTELTTTTWWLDADQDGFGAIANPLDACDQPIGYVDDATDCDDGDGDVFPGAAEVCNGIDDDCDPSTVEVLVTSWADEDGDGYGDPAETTEACDVPPGFVDNDDDCDPADAELNLDCETTTRGKTGCNCDSTPVPSGLGLLALLALLGLRRRNAA